MIGHIFDAFDYNTNMEIGQDERYHTVYFIEFETGQYYIGKHTSNDPSKDMYFCSGKAAIMLKNKGIKYKRTILFYFRSADEAVYAETSILSTKKIFENENCLNCYPGSPPNTTGFITISKDSTFKVINPKLLDYYISIGWAIGGVRRIYVYKDEIQTKVLPEDLDKYLNEGWSAGKLSTRDCIFIEKDGVRKFIKKWFLKQYENEGWIRKHNVKDTKVLRKDGKIIKVRPENLEQKLLEGYSPSSITEGLIYIKKDNEYKRVHVETIDQYLEKGWELGNNMSGSVYINDGKNEKRIDPLDMCCYPNWSYGRLHKTYLNDGKNEKRIYSQDVDTINTLLSQGYKHGRLIRERKIRMYKDGYRKVIPLSKTIEYEENGWIY